MCIRDSSKHTESKAHLLPTLHKLAATRGAADGGVKALPGPLEAAQQEHTSIQMNRVSELQVQVDRFNHDTNWVVSFGKYEEGQVWIEQPNGRFAPPNLPDSSLRGEFHSTHNRWLHFNPTPFGGDLAISRQGWDQESRDLRCSC
eukprot:6427914-Amphidinium_carterae.1